MWIGSAIRGSAIEIRQADEGDAVAGPLDPVLETPARVAGEHAVTGVEAGRKKRSGSHHR